MITVYFTKLVYSTGAQDWLHVLKWVDTYLYMENQGLFYPTHMIERIDLR